MGAIRRVGVRSKLNWSIEKQIERLFYRSEKLGWSHDEFAIYLFEVLMVLRQRNKMKKASVSKKAAFGKLPC
jgi:hypothetical protein